MRRILALVLCAVLLTGRTVVSQQSIAIEAKTQIITIEEK